MPKTIQELKLDAAMWFGPTVTLFEQGYKGKETGEVFVETDVETDKYIIIISDNLEDLKDRLYRCDFINQQVYNAEKQILCVTPNIEHDLKKYGLNVLFFSKLNDLFDYAADEHYKSFHQKILYSHKSGYPINYRKHHHAELRNHAATL